MKTEMVDLFCTNCGSTVVRRDDGKDIDYECPVCGGSLSSLNSVSVYTSGTFRHHATGRTGLVFQWRPREEQIRLTSLAPKPKVAGKQQGGP